MAGPSDIEVLRTVEYRKAVGFQLNEIPGKLKALCGSADTYSSKKAQIEDRFDDLTAEERVGRNTDTRNTDASAERRWIVKPRPMDVSPLIDRDDQLATEIGIKSPLAIQTAKAIRRGQDSRFLQGYYGTAYVGEDGASQVAFKAANIMAANHDEAGNTGITLNKLIAMRAQMMANFVDDEGEELICIYTSKQLKDLLKIAQIQSRDYNPQSVQALQNGRVTHFMGFTFVPAEIGAAKAYPQAASLTVDGSGHRRIPFFLKSGMHWGSWGEDFFGRVSERPDKNYSLQIYGEFTGAATRVNEDKCYQMLCAE